MFVGCGVVSAWAAPSIQIEMSGSMGIEGCGAAWAKARWCYGL